MEFEQKMQVIKSKREFVCKKSKMVFENMDYPTEVGFLRDDGSFASMFIFDSATENSRSIVQQARRKLKRYNKTTVLNQDHVEFVTVFTVKYIED